MVTTVEARQRRSGAGEVLAGLDLRPPSAAQALVSLDAASARFRQQDDLRAVFPDVYGVITRNVVHATSSPWRGVFLEPAWVARLAGRFAERYFDALADDLAGRPTRSAAWRVAFARSAACGPAQNAMLGINAHINFDLAQGLLDNVVAHGPADEAKLARYRHDHDAVNDLLAASMPETLDLLAHRYACSTARRLLASRSLTRGVSEAVLATLRVWRARVWDDLLALLRAPSRATHEVLLGEMDQRSHRIARQIAPAGVLPRLGLIPAV